ncbi:MAG: hypothetical protein AAFV53_27060 [Myxococcota bacterium]
MRSIWLSVALLVGCDDSSKETGDDGSGISAEDQATAEAIWSEIDGYESWGQFTGFEGIRAGTSVHTDFVQVWFNDSALASISADSPLSDGDIGVKETYSDEAGTSLSNITIYKVIDGFSADHNDVFWARYSAAGDVQLAGEESGCYECHESVDSDGDLITVDE